MSKDYKEPSKKSGRTKNGSGSLLIGILIGLLLGLAIALAVAWYINRTPTPFLNRAAPPAKNASPEIAKTEDKSGKAPVDKPRFDFYKILPGTEEPATELQFKEAQKQPPTAQTRDSFFLQVGAFQTAADADNLKARLALLGVEAAVQTATSPDKGSWHRVRVGPYAAIEDLNSTRDLLKQNGIETSIIKVRDATTPPAK
jgi:cell division protein FtsN